MYDEKTCVVVGQERDSSKKSGTIVEVQKEGFVRDGRVLRAAEVVIVR